MFSSWLEMNLLVCFRQTPLQSLTDQEEKKGLIAGYVNVEIQAPSASSTLLNNRHTYITKPRRAEPVSSQQIASLHSISTRKWKKIGPESLIAKNLGWSRELFDSLLLKKKQSTRTGSNLLERQGSELLVGSWLTWTCRPCDCSPWLWRLQTGSTATRPAPATARRPGPISPGSTRATTRRVAREERWAATPPCWSCSAWGRASRPGWASGGHAPPGSPTPRTCSALCRTDTKRKLPSFNLNWAKNSNAYITSHLWNNLPANGRAAPDDVRCKTPVQPI